MHQTTAIKSDRIILTIPAPKVTKGHQAHRGGAGKHGDRRQKRLKTRRNITCAAMQE